MNVSCISSSVKDLRPGNCLKEKFHFLLFCYRYYAIVHPIRAQYVCTISQARRIIIATWIAAFLLAVPILFAQVCVTINFNKFTKCHEFL